MLKVIWTKHAVQRAKELRINDYEKVYLNAQKTQLKPGRYNYKLFKYGPQQLDVKYMSTKKLTFVVREYPDAEVILTVFKKKRR